jgi:hypothetical protein
VNGAEPKLNDCGCCEGIEKLTPAPLSNLLGLTALGYRVGTHSEFKQSMQVDLSASAALRGLKTRSDDDPTMGLLDAWAVTLDVLAFYQERIANEGYLRTATERRSLLELAREIGYELRPGIAASTYLAFNLETAKEAPDQVYLPSGIKAQSIPEQGQQAQMFETIEDIVARPQWNKLLPRLTQHQQFLIDDQVLRYKANNAEVTTFYFNGTSTGLAPGDLLLVTVGSGASTKALSKRVLSVTADAKRTKVRIESSSGPTENLPDPPPVTQFESVQFVPNAPTVPFNQGNIQTRVLKRSLRERDLATFLELNGWQATDLEKAVAKIESGPVPDQAVYALRERAGFFGNNAPPYQSLRNKDGNPLFTPDWDNPGWKIWDPYPNEITSSSASGSLSKQIGKFFDFEMSGIMSKVDLVDLPNIEVSRPVSTFTRSPDAFLERNISGIIPGSWAVFVAGNERKIYKVTDVTETSLTGFAMSGKSSRLSLAKFDDSAADMPDDFLVRTTTAYVKSEPLELAMLPVTTAIEAHSTALTLDRIVLRFQPGQLVVLTGERKDASGVTQTELLEVQEAIHRDGHTTLLFSEVSKSNGLLCAYQRNTVALNANVARATHGETKQEVLGSGDASTSWQKFNLKQSPLTYVAAPTPAGMASTLELRVNDILWQEVPSFYELSPQDRKYVVRRCDDAKSMVEGGNWVTGSGFPTGVENITAKYRVGSGLDGMVKAGQISILLSRPAGLKDVTNPFPAAGGADSEQRDQARENAPVTVLTLDRIVSLQDYEDFARSYPGIGKAQAVWLWGGENKIVHITIAGADGNPIDPTSDLYRNLRLSIKAASDPGHVVRVDSFGPLSFNVSARLVITSGYLAAKVLAQASMQVGTAFSFHQRTFGQAVTRSELEVVMQAVAGVDAVILDKFYFSSRPQTCQLRLPARTARWNNTHQVILPAELLLMNPREIQLTQTQP